MQEAEAAAQVKAQENAALLEEENNKKAQEAIAKANRIANGQMDDSDYLEYGEEEEEQLSNVEKWLLTAPTVESIEQAGAEVQWACPHGYSLFITPVSARRALA